MQEHFDYSDADADPVDVLGAGDHVIFLTGTDADVFTIDNVTGEIFWNNPADYEDLGAAHNIEVTAIDFNESTG